VCRPLRRGARSFKLAAASAAVAASCALAVTAPAHASWACCQVYQYFSGYVAPGKGGDSGYDDLCNTAIHETEAHTPGYYYSTVALIDHSGGWRRSARGNTATVFVTVSPDTLSGARAYSKKAHCNNSDNAFVYSMQCVFSELYETTGICVA
jgi:hypothetical protein